MNAGPAALMRHLKRYAHLFVEDGPEGEHVSTFHINKTMDLTLASGLIPTPHRSASDSPRRLGHMMTTCCEALSQVAAKLAEPPTEEHQLPNPIDRSEIDNAPCNTSGVTNLLST